MEPMRNSDRDFERLSKYGTSFPPEQIPTISDKEWRRRHRAGLVVRGILWGLGIGFVLRMLGVVDSFGGTAYVKEKIDSSFGYFITFPFVGFVIGAVASFAYSFVIRPLK